MVCESIQHRARAANCGSSAFIARRWVSRLNLPYSHSDQELSMDDHSGRHCARNLGRMDKLLMQHQ